MLTGRSSATRTRTSQNRRQRCAYRSNPAVHRGDDLGDFLCGGAPAEERRYFELKAARASDFIWGEGELNEMGYALLHRSRASEAVSIFDLNAREHPESWNVHDSLGDAYLAAGDAAVARRAFARSLELNPQNEHAREAIRHVAQ